MFLKEFKYKRDVMKKIKRKHNKRKCAQTNFKCNTLENQKTHKKFKCNILGKAEFT